MSDKTTSRRPLALPIDEPSGVSTARHLAANLAREIGFSRTEAEKVAIAVSEAGSNMVKHARGGEAVFRVLRRGVFAGVEMLALDRGPGMYNVSDSLRDGYSTSGSMGGGLGAISRLASTYEIYSRPQLGTALLARFWPSAAGLPAPDPFAGLVVPKPGQDISGDGWASRSAGERLWLVVLDGLGHGPQAAEASRAGLAVFDSHPDLGPADLLEVMHAELRPTRGAAGAVALVDLAQRQVIYAGVGNISAVVTNPAGRHAMVSYYGTLGHEVQRIREFVYPLAAGANLLVMHSDGVSAHWDVARYPGLTSCDTALIAGVLYRDHVRRTDDATLAVARLDYAREGYDGSN